ncbi:hypothetical protein [Limosilactobacillus reuteri]|uniref:hypothetical protein n=1 Tax=Limosilactobacillus reuteri TaxID=1598 RepID=UPI00129A7D93|nr:hypothetical protein [Limosilactobacillus reuteri]MRH31652.1 hypothetical protein [Limosilactobacillus reuteri]
MSLIEKTTALADGFRSLYGTTDKYSLADMKTALSGLQIHNFFDKGQSLDTTKGDNAKDLQGLTVDGWNQYLRGKVITFSCDIEWSGYVESTLIGNRIGFEIQTTDTHNGNQWYGPWYYPQSEAGSTHLLTTQYIPEKAIKSIEYCSAYNQINSTATVKVTNFKMVVNPMGEDK